MVNKDKQSVPKKRSAKKKEKVLVVAQEIKFARVLSGNEKKHRDRVLKTLRKWFFNYYEKKYEFKEDDFVRVWKGLFYAMWMADKPLVQEELSDDISGIVDVLPAEGVALAALWTRAGLRVMATEWYGLDQHRIDKFLMLVRRMVRAWFRCMRRCDWSEDSCRAGSKLLAHKDGLFAPNTPVYARNALSLQLHITDCYLEELAKVSGGAVPAHAVVRLVRPFAVYMARGPERRLSAACARSVFYHLIRQSELGLEYEERRRAWAQMGCPRGGPEALELEVEEVGEEEEEEVGQEGVTTGAMDPRAGHVDTVLPCLPVPAAEIAAELRRAAAGAVGAAHVRLKVCRQRFEQLSRREYPLRVETGVREGEEEARLPGEGRAARRLRALEDRLVASSDVLALRGLSKKHKKRVLAAARQNLQEDQNGEAELERPEVVRKQKKGKAKQSDTNDKENSRGDKKAKKRSIPHDNGDATAKKAKVPAEDKETKTKIDRTMRSEVKGASVDRNKRKSDTQVNGDTSTPSPDKKKKTSPLSSNKKKNTPPSLLVNKVKKFKKESKKTADDASKAKNYQKPVSPTSQKESQAIMNAKKSSLKKNDKRQRAEKVGLFTQKKVKFALTNNSMQAPKDYYRSVRDSPSIPYDGARKPSKTNLKPGASPSPINPFFKKKLRARL